MIKNANYYGKHFEVYCTKLLQVYYFEELRENIIRRIISNGFDSLRPNEKIIFENEVVDNFQIRRNSNGDIDWELMCFEAGVY